MRIKFLNDQGVPKSQIAQQLGVSRQTVYNVLSGAKPATRPKRPSKLDPFKEYIQARLERFNLPATTLYQEIHKRGYEGRLSILRDYIRPIKARFTQRVTERFETLPGMQAQIDWGECGTIDVDGVRRKLYVFVFVLGYSRMLYARFTTSTKLPYLLRCLLGAFEALGIPSEILVDNMKQVVDVHDVERDVVTFNAKFLDFAEHHDFMVAATPPYWPRAKGKVERGVGYIKSSFLEGRSFTDLADLNAQLEVWLHTVANVRVHGTTGERPVDRYRTEQAELSGLSTVPPFDARAVEVRKVANDSHISYHSTRYSVDPKAVGMSVTIRSVGDSPGERFSVYLGEELVAEHRRKPRGTRSVTLGVHQAAIERLTRGQCRGLRPGRQPRYEQVASGSLNDACLYQYQSLAPAVETRSLADYEAFAQAVAA